MGLTFTRFSRQHHGQYGGILERALRVGYRAKIFIIDDEYFTNVEKLERK